MLNLPPSFKSDIAGRDTALVPIVKIGDIYISTNSLTYDGEVILPLLISNPSLKESIDIEKRNYKISNISITISNFPYEGQRFSERVEGSLINEPVEVYWISPSTATFEDAGNSALMIYSGQGRRYTHDDTSCKITAEDSSQATLHKDLPLEENYLTDDDVPDKYKNKPIPMVYGNVDRSPCVIGNLNELSSEYSIIADSANVGMDQSDIDPLYIYSENLYIKVLRNSINHSLWGYSEALQYQVNSSDGSILTASIDNSSPSNTSLSDGAVEVELMNDPVKKLYTAIDNYPFNEDGGSRQFPATYFGEPVFIHRTKEGDGTIFSNNYKIDYTFNSIPNAFIDEFNVKIHCDASIELTNSNLNSDFALAVNLLRPNLIDNIFEEAQYDAQIGESHVFINNGYYSVTPEKYYETWEGVFDQKVTISAFIATSEDLDLNEGHGIHTTLIINNFYAKINYLFKDFISQDFYANVIGRATVGANFVTPLWSVVRNILNEIGYDGETDYSNVTNNWQYAFTVDKKINSKKLIEGIASASPYIPRFDNMGNFKFDVIPEAGGTADHTIKEADCIDYSFSRTKIEDVYTKVIFKYNWDYARGDFNDSVESEVYLILGGNYKFEYYGLAEPEPDDAESMIHPESTLIIDDDRGKYIRDEETARKFADWFLLWSCNQHLKMKIKLPLKYMNLEIGDLVDFDAILGGVEPYGIDYTINSEVNGQVFYKNFLITSTNKTLEWVEIECILMHDLTGEEVADTIFEADTPYYVTASMELDGILIMNIKDYLPFIDRIYHATLGSARWTGADNSLNGWEFGGDWGAESEEAAITGGDTYNITFSSETATSLFTLL